MTEMFDRVIEHIRVIKLRIKRTVDVAIRPRTVTSGLGINFRFVKTVRIPC